MNRSQISDVLRAASRIADDRPVVLGSQSILGTFDADQLPEAATVSMEADLAFLEDHNRAKADAVTAAIGEDSNFHQLRGYYAEGIHVETARLPQGWQDRLVMQQVPAGSNGPGVVAFFLEPHDLAAAKLAAFREKDVHFVSALVKAQLIDVATAVERLNQTDLHDTARHRAMTLLDNLSQGAGSSNPPGSQGRSAGLRLSPSAEDTERLRRSQQRASRAPRTPPGGPRIG